MHFDQSSLLIGLIGKAARIDVNWTKRGTMGKVSSPDKPVAPRNSGNRIEHYFCAFAAQEWTDELGFAIVPKAENWISEHCDKVRVRSLGSEIADKDAILLGVLLMRCLAGRVCWRRRVRGNRGRWGRNVGGPVQEERSGAVRHLNVARRHLCKNRGGVGW